MDNSKRHNSNENIEKLYMTARAQLGYFTARQAEKAGFRKNNHSYHVQVGNWIREHRGIYLLSQFPPSEYGQFMLWYLWSRDRNEIPQAVFSYETALSLYDLSDANPSKIHITVPKGFRRKGGIPEILVLHTGNISKSDCRDFNGFKITTPIRTIADLISSKAVSDDIVRQATREALDQGLITVTEVKTATKDLKAFLVELSKKGSS